MVDIGVKSGWKWRDDTEKFQATFKKMSTVPRVMEKVERNSYFRSGVEILCM